MLWTVYICCFMSLVCLYVHVYAVTWLFLLASCVLRSRSSVKGFGTAESLKQKLSQVRKGFECFFMPISQRTRPSASAGPLIRVPPEASRRFT
jgi:hypothetical protein